MRNFLTLLFVLIPFCCFSQFFDDFSDTNIFKENGWQGDLTHFIHKDDRLQLKQAGKSGTSTLFAPYQIEGAHIFEFRVRLDFNPSKYNYTKIYLFSENQTFENAVYVQLGDADDALSLCCQKNKEQTNLIRSIKRVDATSNDLTIRVVRDNTGWTLYSQNDMESSFRKEGFSSALPLSQKTKGYLGIQCIYTSTYSQKFFYHFFQITSFEEKPDPDKPIDPTNPEETVIIENEKPIIDAKGKLAIDSIRFLSNTEIFLFFNKNIDISQATMLFVDEQYALTMKPTQLHHIIKGSVNRPLLDNEQYTVLYHNIFNRNGEREEQGIFNFIYKTNGNPSKPDDSKPDSDSINSEKHPIPRNFGDIVITEIMANPKGISGLPEVEYIELLNRSDSLFNLKGSFFHYGPKAVELPDTLLASHEYIILCHASKSALFNSSVQVLPIPAFPAIANTGKLIYLENKSGNLLHWIEYSDQWYDDPVKDKGGYSLEAIDCDNLYSSPTNWKASQSLKGGTPAYPNSIADENPDHVPPYIIAHSKTENGNLSLFFSKPIFPDAIKDLVNDDRVEQIYYNYPQYQDYQIKLNSSEKEDRFTISLNNICCLSGNPLLERGVLIFGTPDTLQKGDICINELMLNPLKEDALFIELLNHSDKLIDLSEIRLATLKSDSSIETIYSLTQYVTLWEPGCYAVISADPICIFNYYGYKGTPQIICPEKFPSLKPEKGNIALIDRNGNLLDLVYYDESKHVFPSTNNKGISLERINPKSSSSDIHNWIPGDANSLYATPGYKNNATNHVFDEPDTTLITKKGKHFNLIHEKVRLNPDYPESELGIDYIFEQDGYRVNIALYNGNGLKVCQLATDLAIAQSGSLYWKEDWRNSRTAFPGIYILIIEYFDKQKDAGKEKLIFPIVP